MSHRPDMPERGVSPLGRAADAASPAGLPVAGDQNLQALGALIELSRSVNSLLDERQLASTAMLSVMGHVGATVAALWLTDDSSPTGLRLLESSGVHSGVAARAAELITKITNVSSVAPDDPIWLTDQTSDGSADHAALGELTRLLFLIPITATGERIGMIGLGKRATGQPYSAIDIDMIRTMLRVVGVSIENVRLYAHLNRRNRDLEEANRSLRVIDQMKSDFLQTVNHELRTPIAVILGAIECIAPLAAVQDNAGQFTDMIREQANRLREMVQSMLEFTTLTASEAALKCAYVDMKNMVERYCAGRRTRVEKSGHSLQVSIDDSVPAARCNEEHLERVLDRLLDNAMKFASSGTQIEIALSNVVDRRQAWVSIGIRDQGPGIQPGDLQRLFRVFQQIDGSMTREHGGLGLGLAVAKRAVELMDGKVVVESVPGSGTVFQVLLRAREAVVTRPVEMLLGE